MKNKYNWGDIYHYNETCHGKNQYDCESIETKCIIRSYVDAGNDLLASEDTYHVLHYGNGLQNAEISLVALDAKKSRQNFNSKD